MIKLHIDGETFSGTGIKQGLSRYFADRFYELMMLAWAVDNDPVRLWVPKEGEPMPAWLDSLLRDPSVIIYAHNAVFEWHILKMLGYNIPLSRFRCSQVHAYSMGFFGRLGDIQDQIGMSIDKRKLKTGDKLINLFCSPAPKNHKADRYDHTNRPDDWELFKAYCKQDVVAERELEVWLDQYPPITEVENTYWLLDHHINQRGMQIDLELVDAAIDVDAKNKHRIKEDLKNLTGLPNPGSARQFLGWLYWNDVEVPDVRKETLKPFIDSSLWEGTEIQDAITLRAELTKTSNAKWKKIRDMCSTDGRVRNVFQFAGAQRTKRWAGRGLQPHNLPSSAYDDPEQYAAAVETILCRDPRLIDAIWGNPSNLLSQSIRGSIIAAPGHKLVVNDYSAVESRVLGWLANCSRINGIFAEGKDTYKDFAMELFQVAYEDVTPKQRKFCKPPVLGAGYMLGWRGLIAYAAGMGVIMTKEEAKHAIETYRRAYPEVVHLWGAYLNMIEQALHKPGHWFQAGRVSAVKVLDMLLIQLPSGRFLHYYKPLWQKIPAPWDEKQRIWAFTYLGKDQDKYIWQRIDAHAGKVTENFDQAISRDKLAADLLAAENAGLRPVGHVHDEPICEVKEQHAPAALEYLQGIMNQSPTWAPDLLMGSAGWIGDRYRKD